MKNNCDVSGGRPWCGGKDCEHFTEYVDGTCIDQVHNGYCVNMTAIRAAIEAEPIVDANKMVARDCENCKHAEVPAMKGPCETCVVMQNWEPADAGEKGE